MDLSTSQRRSNNITSQYHHKSLFKRYQSRPSSAQICKIETMNFGTNLFLSNKRINSFVQLDLKNEFKEINLSKNEIKDFLGFPSLANLHTLDLSENPIESLKGFPKMNSLSTIMIKNSPFSRSQFYRIGLLLVCPTLKIIDGQHVSNVERQLAKSYPVECQDLVRNGWIPKYPPPKENEFSKIRAKMVSSNRTNNRNTNYTKNSEKKRKLQKQSLIFAANIQSQNDKINSLLSQIEEIEARINNQQHFS